MSRELVENESYYTTLLKQKQLFFVVLSENLKVQEMNVAAEQVFGPGRNKNAAEVLLPDATFRPQLRNAQHLFAAIHEKNAEFVSIVNPDVYIHWIIHVTNNTERTLQRFIMYGFEVSAYKLAEQKLFRLEDMIRHLPGNVYWMDANCVHMGCNDNVLKMLGLTREQYVGTTYEQLAVIADWKGQGESFKQDDLEVLRTRAEKAGVEEPALPHKDGSVHYYLTTRVPLFNKRGEIDGVAGISTDITDLKKIEAELRTAKEKAEAMAEAKSQFLANISHDFLTPLAAIINGIDAIATHGEDPSKRLEYCADIKTTADTLTHYVQDILEVAQFNHNGVPMRSELFDMRKFIAEIENIFKSQAKRKGLKFIVDYPEGMIDHLVSDKHRIRRILTNLLGNAIKFTASGQVALKIRTDLVSQDSTRLSITVADTGIGIPENKLGVIFDKFMRLTPSYEGHYKGAGMGLNIALEFAEQLQGTLTVKSEVGKGTVFLCDVLCSLPNAKATRNTIVHHTQASPQTPTLTKQTKPLPDILSDLTDLKILLVEDDRMIQKFTQLLLAEFGCQIAVAKDGEEAIQLTETTDYDLILLDLGLPDQEGVVVAETIFSRGREKHAKPIKIAALTAHGGVKERNACLAAGIQYFCQKPLTKDELFKICRHLNLGK